MEDFLSSLKPRVMSLAIFTSICGLFLAPTQMHPFFIFLSILCISIGAGASGAINMWYDQDIDGLMVRTKGQTYSSRQNFSSRRTWVWSYISFSFCSNIRIGSKLFRGISIVFLNFFLCFYLYYMVKKKNPTKYCYRRGCWSISTCNWLGVFYW